MSGLVDLAPYEAILAHSELELELAGRGDVEALGALGARWDELVASVPSSPPPSAASLLERATLIHDRTRIELIRLREALLADLATSRRARRTAEGYAGQLAPRPRLDRSA
ncbi:MAG: hypothetical protein ACYDHN_01865 [Solirubrobacteraceae bacterium]